MDNLKLTTGQKISKALTGRKLPEYLKIKLSEIHKKLGTIPPNHKGKKHSPETIEKMRLSKTGAKNPMYKKEFSVSHRKRLSSSLKKVKHTWATFGENNHFWKGGITPINIKIRMSLEYKLWRESVFKRDNHTCVWCGQKGGKLNADHIKSFSLFPELRFAIDNGRTLCVQCHRKTDTYGYKSWIKKNG